MKNQSRNTAPVSVKYNTVAFAICVMGLLFAGNSAARAQSSSQQATFNPVNDWTWSYLGYSPNLPPSGLTVLTSYCDDGACFPSAPKLACWTNGSNQPSFVQVCKNQGPGAATYDTVVQPPDLLRMDPEDGIVTVRFIVPATGVYSFSGRYQMIDTVGNEVLVSIVRHEPAFGVLLPLTQLRGYGNSVPFNIKASLPAGTTVDFTINTGGNYTNESTGLKVDVAAIP
jgi:hypothetical protein